MAINAGADALGLVGPMPSGPGTLNNGEIAAIAPTIPAGVSSFLLTCETHAEKILYQYRICQTNTIQLVDKVSFKEYEIIRKAYPALRLVQVIHVIDEKSVEEALAYGAIADGLLLDSGQPSKGILGGTGNTHNWKLSREICDKSPIPVWLAGGLTAENVRGAIEEVQPFGVDLCSSIRTNGLLNQQKLLNFVQAVGNLQARETGLLTRF